MLGRNEPPPGRCTPGSPGGSPEPNRRTASGRPASFAGVVNPEPHLGGWRRPPRHHGVHRCRFSSPSLTPNLGFRGSPWWCSVAIFPVNPGFTRGSLVHRGSPVDVHRRPPRRRAAAAMTPDWRPGRAQAKVVRLVTGLFAAPPVRRRGLVPSPSTRGGALFARLPRRTDPVQLRPARPPTTADVATTRKI